jgi:hypothetical protein
VRCGSLRRRSQPRARWGTGTVGLCSGLGAWAYGPAPSGAAHGDTWRRCGMGGIWRSPGGRTFGSGGAVGGRGSDGVCCATTGFWSWQPHRNAADRPLSHTIRARIAIPLRFIGGLLPVRVADAKGRRRVASQNVSAGAIAAPACDQVLTPRRGLSVPETR